MTAPVCDAPVQGGCAKPAKSVILARAGENMVGNGMAVWTAYFRCEEDHFAARDAGHIQRADPEAVVYTVTGGDLLEPGTYAAVRVGGTG